MPANKRFSLTKCLWGTLRGMDFAIHGRFMRAFPAFLPRLDKLLEVLFGIVTHPAFAIISALLLMPLAATNVINTIVAVSLAAAVSSRPRRDPFGALNLSFPFKLQPSTVIPLHPLPPPTFPPPPPHFCFLVSSPAAPPSELYPFVFFCLQNRSNQCADSLNTSTTELFDKSCNSC